MVGVRPRFLSVALGAVVRLTEQLAVTLLGRTALGPRGDMVSIHFFERPDLLFLLLVTDSAVGTVGDALLLSSVCLTLVDAFLHCFSKDSHVQQLRIRLAAKQVLVDTLLGLNLRV